MITYSKEAQASYLDTISRMQRKLAQVVPTDNLTNNDLHWLIHTALKDLERQVVAEHHN